ncbi:MAG: phbC, partial [Candidatus Eremiobacteraeota bacterium]|nr:phbC [Candidatus Eremiobacteraeota bacterium]
LEAQMELGRALSEVAVGTAGAVAGAPARPPLIEPEPGDKRFSSDAWTANPYFDALKQAYLLSSRAVLDTVDRAEGLDPQTRQRLKFFTRQFVDAMSPTNVPWLNPDVLAATLQTGGANLQQGLQHVAADREANDGRPALVDATAFEVGRNVATTAGSVVFRNELIELIQYAPTQSEVYARPLVIVPPWINKFYVLDLQPANSFVKYATDAGRNTFVLSWRNPTAEMRDFTMADYLRLGPLTAARVAAEIAGTDQVDAVGYCIGGTLLSMALAYQERSGTKPIATATFFAALVDFADPGDVQAFISEESLSFMEERMNEQGYLSGREMADSFNLLRSNDLIWQVAVNRYLLGKEAPAFDLLYWNADATRIPAALHSYYLRQMYLENNLVKPDVLEADGVPLALQRIETPTYIVATAEDHIAPWRSVYRMTQIFAGEVTFRLGASGHIAGIISPPGKKKAAWWGNAPGTPSPPDPDEWLAGAEKHDGSSWWPDWTAWLAERSPDRVVAPAATGSPEHAALASAPGTYVLAR